VIAESPFQINLCVIVSSFKILQRNVSEIFVSLCKQITGGIKAHPAQLSACLRIECGLNEEQYDFIFKGEKNNETQNGH
jgi:hypothetical protein